MLEEITSQKRFNYSEFAELLERIGVKISNDRIPTLQKLFEQMSERQEELSRAKIIMCFGREFTNIGRAAPQQRRGSLRQLPEPPYAVNAFCAWLVNADINLRTIFADSIQSKRIKI